MPDNTEINTQIRQAAAQRLQRLREQQEQRAQLEAKYGVVLATDWIERATAWLVEKWGNERECPYCGNPTWGVGGRLIEARQWSDAGVIPMLQVTCTNCGHTVSVDAAVAGLIEQSQEP